VVVTGEQRNLDGTDCQTDGLTGLPDGNCYFIPHPNNTVKSSYMALPFLDSVTDFCDDISEENIHHTEVPTKQNLYCDGKSSWSVIMENADFINGANEPATGLDTEPEFVIVKPTNTKYVIVMDVSLSMVPHPPYFIDRALNMKDAAKRFVKYEVEDGTEVAMVVFSDVVPTYDPVIYHMKPIDDTTRDEMVDAINDMEFTGKTCIGCGLDRALNWAGGLEGASGGVIILITDGEQLCSQPDGCLSAMDELPLLLERKTKVVSIALGVDADPAIEEIAVATGGKSYYIDDSSGQGTINDAFSGSLTYQPGDTLNNSNTVVHQTDFNNVHSGDKLKGFFDIDSSIGRDVVFEVNSKATDNICVDKLDILLVSPDDDQSVQTKFQCDPQNFGVFRHEVPDLAQTGRWVYVITANEALESVSVKVQSKSRDESADPILTKCWIATGSQSIDTDINVKLAVVAEVTQGTNPVIGAKVNAEIIRPPAIDGTPYPPMEIELTDNGSGADKIKNDGTYSRYFASFTGRGRYSVKCQVAGDEDTGVNNGWIGRKNRVYPQNPTTPLCCGSNALPPGAESQLPKTGNFTRQSPGGAFQVTNDFDPNVDKIPPGQVTDLKATLVDNSVVEITFTAPGDDMDSDDNPAEYIFKYSLTAGNLTGENFENDEFKETLEAGNLIDSDLNPVSGGSTKTILISTEIFQEGTKYVLAMKAKDEAGNAAKVSNLVEIYLTSVPTTTTSTTIGVPQDCDAGWIPGPEGCYAFYIYKDFNWADAQAGCQSVNAWLAEPKTEAITNFLNGYMSQFLNSGVRTWWIGLSDLSDGRSWSWAHSGTDLEEGDYTNWSDGYPYGGNCAILDYNIDPDYRWASAACYGRTGAPICQKGPKTA